MDYLNAEKTAEKWGISQRSVRNYCAQGRVAGAKLIGKTWHIPADAPKPGRANAKAPALAQILREQMAARTSGGIYHKIQIDLTYNSNHMEGSRLTHDQTRLIFETNTVGMENGPVNVDDVIETANHFRCVDTVIRQYDAPLTEKFIQSLHAQLKTGTSDSRRDWFAVGAYKRYPNEVGGLDTAPPEEVPRRMAALLKSYRPESLEDLMAFHVAFERIHPFQDGNGRVGRLILFKECLRCGITPFIIEEDLKWFYYRGLSQWDRETGYLLDRPGPLSGVPGLLPHFGILEFRLKDSSTAERAVGR